MDINGQPLSFTAEIQDKDFATAADRILASTKKIHDAEIKRLTESSKAQTAYNNLLLSSGGAFKNLDRDTALQLKSLQGLQSEFSKVAAAKEALNKAFSSGNTSQASYQTSLAALVKQENDLVDSMAKVSAELAKSESFQKAANNTLATKAQQITNLTAAYDRLSKAEQQGSTGKALQDNISALKGELSGLERSFKAISENAFGKLSEQTKELERVKEQYSGILKLQEELARIPAQKLALDQDFEQNQQKAQNYRQELGKLNQQENTLKDNINATKAALKASDAQYDQNSKKIKQEVTQLEKLKAVYAELSKVNPTTPAAKSTNQDISRLEKSVAKGQDAEAKILAERAEQAQKYKVQLEELNRIKQVKTEFKDQFGDSTKYITVYREELAKLNIQEKELNQQVAAQTTLAQSNEGVWKAVTQAIEQRTAKIKELEASYDKLNDSDKQAPNIGGAIKAEIAGLAQQIDVISANFQQLGTDAGQALLSKTQAVKSEFASIAGLQLDSSGMLADLSQLQEQTKGLKASLTDMPTFTVEGIQENTEKLAKLRTTFDNLSEVEKVSVFGQNTLAEITQVEGELRKVDTLISSLPVLTLGEIDNKKKQLADLNRELNSLSDTDKLDLNIGGAIEAQIKALNSQIDTLELNLKDLPNITLGDVQQQVNSLKKLNTEFDALDEAAKINPEIGGKIHEQIKAITTDVEKFKTSLTNMPDLVINGIQDRTEQIKKLQQQLAGLPEGELSVKVQVQADIDKLQGEINGLKQSLSNDITLDLIIQNEGQIKTLQAGIETITNDAIPKLIAQLGKAQEEFNNLSRTQQIDPEIGGKMLAGIRQLEGELSKLGQQVKALPELKLGSIDERVAEIQKLSTAINALPEVQLKDPKIGGAMIQELNTLQKELDDLNQKIRSTPEFKFGSIASKTAELSRLKQEYSELSGIDRRNANVGVQMKKNIQELEKEVKDLNGEFSQTETFAKKALIAAGAYLTIQAGGDLIRDIAKVRGEFEQLEISLTTMLGSKAEANKLLAQVTDLAAQSPYDLKDIGNGAKSLIAYGVAADEAVSTLEMLGNVASGVSIPITELTQTYGKLKTQGRAYSEDINEFTGRGIPIIKELAKQFGVAESEVKNLVEAGKVGFPEVEKAFKSMTGPGGQFKDLMAEQAKGIVGLTSGLSDAFDRMFNDIGKSSEGIIKEGLSSSIALVDNYQKVLDILGLVVVGYGTYRAALVAEAALTQVAAVKKAGYTTATILSTAATNLQAAATTRLNAIMAATPFGVLAAAAGILAISIYSLAQATSAAEASQERFAKIHEQGDLAVNKEKDRINSLISVIQSETATREQKAATVKKLRDTTGELLQGYSDEAIAAGKAGEAIKKYLTELEKKTEIKVAFDELEKLNEELGKLEIKGIGAVTTLDKLAQSLKNTFSSQGRTFGEYVEDLFSGKSANDRIVEQQKAKLKKQADDLKKAYGKDFAGIVSGVTGAVAGVDLNAAFASLLKDVAGNFQKLLDLAKNRNQLEEIQKAVQEKINSLAPGSKEIAGLQAKLKQVNKVLEQYDLKNDTKAAKKSQEDKLKFLEELAKKEAELKRKGLSQDEAALAEAKERYALLRKEAEKLKLGPAVITRINRLEQTETGNLQYEQETVQLQKEVQKQKAIFAEYEDYKEALGKEKADSRFANEKEGFDSYLAFLQSKMDDITVLGIDPKDMTEQMRKRLLQIFEEIKAVKQEEKQNRDAAFIEAYNDTISYQESVLRIESEYQKKVAALRENQPGKDISREVAELRAQANEKIDIARDERLQKSEIYKQLSEEIIQYTRDEVKAQIEATKAALKNADISPELRAKLEKELGNLKVTLDIGVNQGYQKALSERKRLLEQSLATQKLSTAETIKQKKELAEINELLEENPFQKAADTLALVSNSLGEAADLIGKFNKGAGESAAKLAELAGAGATLFAGIASGNPAAIISGAIGTIKGLYDMIDQSDDKRAAAEEKQRKSLERTKAVLQEMNRLLDQQSKAIERALGIDRIAAYQKQLQLINADLVTTIKKINSLDLKIFTTDSQGRRALRDYGVELANLNDIINQSSRPRPDAPFGGVIMQLTTLDQVIEANRASIDSMYAAIASGNLSGSVDELRDLLGTYEELESALESYRNKLREVVTGTTFGGIVDSIADGFRKGFKSAKEQAEFFAKSFEDLMKGAIIESLKMQALEIPLKKFYEEFARNAEDGLDQGEVQNLQDIYNQILKDAQKQFEALQQVAGIDFKDDAAGSAQNKNSLSGAFAAASQESIDLLSGYTAAVRLIQIEQLGVQKQMLSALLVPGQVNLPTGGTSSLTIPGFDLLLGNSNTQTGLQQQLVGVGQQALQVSLDALSVHRQIEVNTRQTAGNTVMIKDVAATLKSMERKMDSNANAIRASGG